MTPRALLYAVLPLVVGCGGPSSQRAVVVGTPASSVVAHAAVSPALDIRPAARTYVVDLARSRFEIFGADIFGGQHRMRFRSWRARVTLDPAPRLLVQVDTASVVVDMRGATGIVRRDVLEVDRFPAATLDASLARTDGPRDEHVVEGIADLHGVKRRLRFLGTLREEAGGYRFRTEFLLSRKEFAIYYAPIETFLKDDVRIVVNAFARPAPESEPGKSIDPPSPDPPAANGAVRELPAGDTPPAQR